MPLLSEPVQPYYKARDGPTNVAPPSTTRVCPVMKHAWSDDSKRTASPMSQPAPSRSSTKASRRASRA
jgi:hypothetical protein